MDRLKRFYRRLIPDQYNDLLSSIKLKPKDLVIDCGANVGHITERMASSGAIVYAFEPNPWAFEVLRQKFLRNSRVHCINKGVLDREGKLKLFLHQNAQENQVKWSKGSSLLNFKENIDKNSFLEIDVIDLSEFIINLRREIKLLKMDVEGVECRILNKLIETRAIYKIEHVLVELHDDRIPELKEETELLKKKISEKNLNSIINLNWG